MDKAEFILQLGKLRPSSTFLTLKGYRNNVGEIADYNIVFHVSYSSALRRSIMALEGYIPNSFLEAQAKQELLDGYQNSIDRTEGLPVDEVSDHYMWFSDSSGNRIKGVKMHIKTETLHLYGFVVHKRVLMPGTYPVVQHKELTIAKNKLRKMCPINSFRQFRISPDQVESISVEKIHLLPPVD